MENMEKKCFRCGLVKPISEFYYHKQMSDGHLNKCKECTKNDVRQRYFNPKFRGKIIEYERKRFQNPRRKKMVVEYARKRKLRNPEHDRARTKVYTALRNGTLKKLNCIVCGDTKSQAHHPDYSKPLFVKWLCFRHHREEHGQTVN